MQETTDRPSRAENCARADPPDLAEMLLLVRKLCREVVDDSEEERIAFAWMLVNARAACGRGEGKAASAPGIALACDNRINADFADAEFCRSLALLCLILAGDLDDPTRGATKFHAHDDWPCWARDAEPRALIGRRIFYAPE